MDSHLVFQDSMTLHRPSDMFSGMSKYGQYYSFSENCYGRMGEDPSGVPVPFLFLDDIWAKLKLIVN